MQTKTHTTFIAVLAGAVLAFAVASPAAFAYPPSEPPAFPSAVPSQPGQLTGTAAATEAARVQERYYASYGDSKPLSRHATPLVDDGVDWMPIGIAIGGSLMLVGALVALVSRTRRTHRARVIA